MTLLRVRRGSSALLTVVLVALSNFALWSWFNQPVEAPDWFGQVKGMSFSPYRAGQDPYAERYPTVAELRESLERLRGHVSSVRTYSSTDGFENVPRLAGQLGLDVTAGAWLDRRDANNLLEVWNLIQSARQNSNVRRVIVGNESILRGDVSVARLREYLDVVRRNVHVPVSTAEPWHIWLKHPELARSVDYIAIHVLPYWEQVPFEEALPWVLERYHQVQAAFPDKPVLIAEVGWPSAGSRFGAAKPSIANAARFVRQFLNTARAERLDYFIMEAFDQPWKKREEGSVGPHWGLFDVALAPKYAMRGAIVADPVWLMKAIAATLIALVPVVGFVLGRRDVRLRGRLFYSMLLQTIASGVVLAVFVPFAEALTPLQTLTWALVFPAQALLVAVALVNGHELTELLWQRRLRREFRPFKGERAGPWPMVSLHVAIHDEPPDLVIATLNSLARLDYPNFEVLVLDNNTRDPAVFLPVERHCARLGARFRFFHLENWPGYKAGALNFGRTQTHPDASIIGVVDSDYVVEPDWLRALVPHFDRSQVGFVQAPQDHREWSGSAFRTMCNWEYNGFFQIGMVSRNERDAIIQHGTMTLIRRSAFEAAGAWSEWCICEDAELGLRLLAHGYESVYVNHVFGRGLVPESFAAYRNQRFRWVYGAVQILKRYWRELLGLAPTSLSRAQRLAFVTGWLPWFADAMHLVFTLAAVGWSVALVLWPRYVEFPLHVFLVPTLLAFVFKLGHSLVLYRARVECDWRERVGAAIAGMALTHGIAIAVFTGLVTNRRPFLRTPKAEGQAAFVQGFLMAREETGLGLLLWLSIALVLGRYGWAAPEGLLWVLVLAAQSVPYFAAFVTALANALPALRLASTRPVPALPALPPALHASRQI